MPGDHLAARQAASVWNPVFQHTLDDLNTGINYKKAGYDYAANQLISRCILPRKGRSGVYLDNAALRPAHAAVGSNATGFTAELVVATLQTGFNFFGGPYAHAIWSHPGYLIAYDINLAPLNGLITDTVGIADLNPRDINVTYVANKVKHANPQINDGQPHYLCMTFAPHVQTDAVKLYVDGVLTQTVTLINGIECQNLDANSFLLNVDDYFTNLPGSYSHCALTPSVLPLSEIQARANLLLKLPDGGQIMGWDATNKIWVPHGMVKGYTGSTWSNRTKKAG